MRYIMFYRPIKIFRLTFVVIAFSTLSAMQEKTIEPEKASNTSIIPDLPRDVLGIIFKEFMNLEGEDSPNNLFLTNFYTSLGAQRLSQL